MHKIANASAGGLGHYLKHSVNNCVSYVYHKKGIVRSRLAALEVNFW